MVLFDMRVSDKHNFRHCPWHLKIKVAVGLIPFKPLVIRPITVKSKKLSDRPFRDAALDSNHFPSRECQSQSNDKNCHYPLVNSHW